MPWPTLRSRHSGRGVHHRLARRFPPPDDRHWLLPASREHSLPSQSESRLAGGDGASRQQTEIADQATPRGVPSRRAGTEAERDARSDPHHADPDLHRLDLGLGRKPKDHDAVGTGDDGRLDAPVGGHDGLRLAGPASGAGHRRLESNKCPLDVRPVDCTPQTKAITTADDPAAQIDVCAHGLPGERVLDALQTHDSTETETWRRRVGETHGETWCGAGLGDATRGLHAGADPEERIDIPDLRDVDRRVCVDEGHERSTTAGTLPAQGDVGCIGVLDDRRANRERLTDDGTLGQRRRLDDQRRHRLGVIGARGTSHDHGDHGDDDDHEDGDKGAHQQTRAAEPNPQSATDGGDDATWEAPDEAATGGAAGASGAAGRTRPSTGAAPREAGVVPPGRAGRPPAPRRRPSSRAPSRPICVPIPSSAVGATSSGAGTDDRGGAVPPRSVAAAAAPVSTATRIAAVRPPISRQRTARRTVRSVRPMRSRSRPSPPPRPAARPRSARARHSSRVRSSAIQSAFGDRP